MKKQLKDLKQTHGKDEVKALKEKHSTLDQILGDNGYSTYKTSNEEEYKLFLDDLNKSDLQEHAVRLGLAPSDNRRIMVERLLTQFKRHWAKYNIKLSDNLGTAEVSKTVKKILSEGV